MKNASTLSGKAAVVLILLDSTQVRNKPSLVGPFMLPLPKSHFTLLKDEPAFLKRAKLLFIDSSRREILFTFLVMRCCAW